MSTATNICEFLRSKLPDTFWSFHGESINDFVQQEIDSLIVREKAGDFVGSCGEL